MLVTWSPCCYLNVYMLIILALFSIIPKLVWNNSRIVSAIKIPKNIPTSLVKCRVALPNIFFMLPLRLKKHKYTLIKQSGHWCAMLTFVLYTFLIL